MSDAIVLERPKRPCPDCGVESVGEFCSECGEAMEPRVLRIRHYFTDIVTEILAFDSKFMHTIPALLFRPGLLPREFVAGRRRRYLSPLRLHIIIGIGLFLSLGYYTRTRLERQESNIHDRATIDSVFQQIHREEAARHQSTGVPKDLNDFKTKGETIERIATEIGPYVLLLTSTPMLATVLWVLYRKRKQLFVEHLIFSLYFFSFAYLLLIPPLLLHLKPLMWVVAALFSIYLYFGLRKYYRDRSYGLIFRTVSCIVACGFISVFTFTLSLFAAWAFGVAMGELPSGFSGGFHVG